MNKSLLFTINEACDIAKSGRSAIYDAIKCGALRARKRGRKTLILAEDLENWVKALPDMLTEAANPLSVGHDTGPASSMSTNTKNGGR
jgi:excisionase family DNA binding protein